MKLNVSYSLIKNTDGDGGRGGGDENTACLHSQRLSRQRLIDVTNAYSRHVLPIG